MATTSNNDTKVPRRLWWVLAAVSLAPILIFMVMRTFISEAGKKSALEGYPPLRAVAKCQPKEFDTLEKAEKAVKLYSEKGLLPWHRSMSCWEGSITKDMLPVRLAVVIAPTGTDKWSGEVKNPHTTQDMQLTRRPLNNDWENCEMIVDKDSQKIMSCEESFNYLSSVLQFRSKGKGNLKVEVRIIPK